MLFSKFASAAIATVLLCSTLAAAQDIGTHLSRTFGLFKELPLTAADATAAGWSRFGSSTCDPKVGFLYAQNANGAGPSRSSQTILSFTANGQLNGWGVRVWTGGISQQLVSSGYWRATGANDNSYDIVVTTRDITSGVVCGSATAPELIGDQLNIWGDVQPIALNMSTAEAWGWVYGDCIGKMGIHHAYDLNAPGNQTWNYQSLVPIQPMYDAVTHGLTAVLVNVPALQEVEPLGEMEGPFINYLFCKNWCPTPTCSFSGVTLWSTIHFHIVPIDSISCSGALCNL